MHPSSRNPHDAGDLGGPMRPVSPPRLVHRSRMDCAPVDRGVGSVTAGGVGTSGAASGGATSTCSVGVGVGAGGIRLWVGLGVADAATVGTFETADVPVVEPGLGGGVGSAC